MPKFARIEYLVKNGERHIQVLEILTRRSKRIFVRRPDDNFEFSILNTNVVEISEPDVTLRVKDINDIKL
jgi:hypothetical protein